jgi:hypothetical protein
MRTTNYAKHKSHVLLALALIGLSTSASAKIYSLYPAQAQPQPMSTQAPPVTAMDKPVRVAGVEAEQHYGSGSHLGATRYSTAATSVSRHGPSYLSAGNKTLTN